MNHQKNMHAQNNQTPEEAIKSVKGRLEGLALEISDNESRLDITMAQVRSLQENRTAMLMEYQKTLHALIAMTEMQRSYVELQQEKAQQEAQKAPDPEKFPNHALDEISLGGRGGSVTLPDSGGKDVLSAMSTINGKRNK